MGTSSTMSVPGLSPFKPDGVGSGGGGLGAGPAVFSPLAVSSTSSWPTCTLSYRLFHLQWTLPLCLLLYLVNRPLLTRLDRAKLVLLPAVAFIWTTPWDNVIVKNQAWFYRRHCIWFTVGYVPIEEYFFFVIQSVATTLWCNLVTRWFLPNLYTSAIPSSPSNEGDARKGMSKASWIVLPTTSILIGGGILLSRSSSSTYYMAMIAWWSAMPLGLLAWGTFDFLGRMGVRQGLAPFFLSVAAPSVYLWTSDIYALRRGTWHINERVSLNVFPVPDLPIEEMVFFVVTNTILVTACYAFDRCAAICRQSAATTPLSPSYLPLAKSSTYVVLWQSFIRSDEAAASERMEPGSSVQQDLALSLNILSKASKSFSAASLLLPWDLRTDLGSLYAFCRVADDLVDDADLDVESKVQRLRMISALLDVIYRPIGSPSADSGIVEAPREGVRKVVGELASQMAPEHREAIRATACSVIPLSGIVPRRLWDEMIKGYHLDLDFERREGEIRGFDSMAQLVTYSQCVAGCVGEMCTRVIMARCGRPVPLDLEVDHSIDLEGDGETTKQDLARTETEAELHSLLYEARRMGVSLQLVNIARDLVPDATELKRCYLPLSMLDKGERHFQQAMLSGRVNRSSASAPVDATGSAVGVTAAAADSVEARQLRKYALRLLALSDRLYIESYPALARLPNRPARAGLRAACSVYAAIGDKIRSQTDDEVDRGERARMSTSDRLRRALTAIYLDG